MYNLDNVVRMYFDSVSVQRVVAGQVSYENFQAQEFGQLSRQYFPQYSDTENRQLYRYIESGMREEGHPYAKMENRGGLNVFAALEELAEQILTLEEDEVRCRYDQLLRLREVTRYVEEDLLVCAYLAVHFRRFGRGHLDFGWNTVIGHNNRQLNRIMEKGISENHFHLYGSAPSFHLWWIQFMNHVEDPMLAEFTNRIERQQQVARRYYNTYDPEEPFSVKIMRAALIRVHILQHLLLEKGENIGGDDSYDVQTLLSGKRDILAYRSEIQAAIDQIRNRAFLSGMGELTDYMLYAVDDIRGTDTEHYWFAGERWMMYKMLRNELAGKDDNGEGKKYYQWLYAYLLLKQHLRSEVVQLNDSVGFENFAIYSKRKSGYTDTSKMIEAAVYGSVERGNVNSLEIRITPEDREDDDVALLRKNDAVIGERKKEFPQSKYYYVFHFTKKEEEPLGERELFDRHCCRHYRKRVKLEQQAGAVCDMRENYRTEAARLLGIDACAQEIGCRPEVFAPIFRHLCSHVVEKVTGVGQTAGTEYEKVRQLKMTYHVGEDFLDVVDGLRAVDEAVHFLSLRCGDRIGHGTVLGIDARKWYAFKQNTILLEKQDYLDNIVWLYHKLSEYRLEGFESLRAWLEKEFERYFAEIYMHRADGSVRDKAVSNICVYYEAWKLRGDDPELYLDGEYDSGKIYGRDWLVNRRYPEQFDNRLRREVSSLYYMYHYDWDVRYLGKKGKEVQVPEIYVAGVCAVQKAFREKFAGYGIGIETNPSSNLAISTFCSYGEHPIIAMYNKDLTWDAEALKECPQLYVSINTDDKGVFHTSLENEYALMACAMEQKKDGTGAPLYNSQMVYQWIDNIREMGNRQSFK